jgi:polysaccharide lyase family 4-like protein
MEARMKFMERFRQCMQWGYRVLLGLSLGMMLGVSGVGAYEEVPVTDAGTLVGVVTFKGGKPVPRGFNLVTFPDPVYCGRISNGHGWRLLPEFSVGENQALKDVVVMFVGVQKGKPFKFQEPRIEARDCRFLPFITVVRDHEKVTVANMDPVMHDIQAYETSELGPRVLFNVPLPMNTAYPEGVSRDTLFQKHQRYLGGAPTTQVVNMTKGRHVFVMQCGFHAYMESWGLVVDNPYYALTDQSGRFEIGDIPPGTYKLFVWHPQARVAIEREVTIPAKGTVAENFEIQPREGARAGMDAVENPRFSLGILGDREIKPTLELQKP